MPDEEAEVMAAYLAETVLAPISKVDVMQHGARHDLNHMHGRIARFGDRKFSVGIPRPLPQVLTFRCW